jgi:tetratricopeptide (TPR) repeat protein
MEDDAEAFLQEVDWVTKEVQDIISGKIDLTESESREKKKKQLEDFRRREKENLEASKLEAKKRGHEGKGIKFDKFLHYCKFCSREFELPTPSCPLCSRETQSSEARKSDLLSKVSDYKKSQSEKAENKLRWENWKKTESLLYKKNSTNYKKWEFFVDETEEDPQPDFVPPENDPNFAALEQDIKTRAEKRAKDLKAANELKEKGNDFYRQGKYRNAIQKYEEAQNFRKDLMVLYTNAAAARIKLEDFQGAVKDCARVIDYFEVFDKEVEGNKEILFKAFYRRGDAHRALQNYVQAVFDYEKAIEFKNEPALESLLERTREEAENGGIQVLTEEINNSQEIIEQLSNDEKINEFRVTGGYSVLFKRLFEAMDGEALKVLEVLMNDESKFIRLQPIILPLYDKRQTAAVILAETIIKYQKHPDFCKKIIKILTICIENKHIREELAKHSSTTKGKKFYKQVLEIASIPDYLTEMSPVISNLCLTSFKSSLYRRPCPGNMKSLIRHSWFQFRDPFIQLLQTSTSEALSLLCNICADPKLKKLVMSESQIVLKGIETCLSGTKSLDIERSTGFLINILVQPTDLALVSPFLSQMWEADLRLFSLDKYVQEIEERAFRLMFRLLMTSPELVDSLSQNSLIINRLLSRTCSVHSDSIAKILAASTSNQKFVDSLNIEKINEFLVLTLKDYISGKITEERLANLCLAVGKIAGCRPQLSLYFQKVIPDLVKVAKEKTGPVRKNVAICLAKICNCEENKEVLRNEHGIEVLNSIMGHLNS